MKQGLLRLLLLGFAWGSLLVGGTASALPVLETLSVFNPNGSLFASVSFTEAQSIQDPSRIVFIGTPGLADPGQLGNSTTVVAPDGTYIDVFGVADLGSGAVLAFNTFNLGSPYGAQSAIFLPLGNGLFNATMYLAASFRNAGYTAQFAAIPLPGSLALVGISLVALAFVRKRMA